LQRSQRSQGLAVSLTAAHIRVRLRWVLRGVSPSPPGQLEWHVQAREYAARMPLACNGETATSPSRYPECVRHERQATQGDRGDRRNLL